MVVEFNTLTRTRALTWWQALLRCAAEPKKAPTDPVPDFPPGTPFPPPPPEDVPGEPDDAPPVRKSRPDHGMDLLVIDQAPSAASHGSRGGASGGLSLLIV